MRSQDDERLLNRAAYEAALNAYPPCPHCRRRLVHRTDCVLNPAVMARHRRTANILLGVVIGCCAVAAGTTLLALAQGWV